jgi:Ca2+-binding RTX toxin-like protein
MLLHDREEVPAVAILRGTSGDDVLIGTPAADRILGLGGDDFLEGAGGDDRLDGGPGFDVASWADRPGRPDSSGARYGMSIDLAAGDAVALVGFLDEDPELERDLVRGIEAVIGTPFRDLILGSAGADLLRGGKGDDEIDAGAGDDLVHGEPGDDVLMGEDGRDRLHGGNGDDSIAGGPRKDFLFGGPGDDTLRGDAGTDFLYGGDGDDVLDEGDDDRVGDLMAGNAGHDIVSYASDARSVTVDLARGTAVQGDELDRLVGIEGATGGMGRSDLLLGDDGANSLATGGGGHDRAFGGAGDDVLAGGAERTLLDAGTGDDVVTGDAGDDTVRGGTGADRLSGGTVEYDYFEPEPLFDHDLIDLGRDRDADVATFELHDFVGRVEDYIGVDRVLNFDPAHDKLAFYVAVNYSPVGGPDEDQVVDVRTALDTNGNGLIDAGDLDVWFDEDGMVIDLESLWEREIGETFLSGQAQQVILIGQRTAFDADAIVSLDVRPEAGLLPHHPEDALL